MSNQYFGNNNSSNPVFPGTPIYSGSTPLPNQTINFNGNNEIPFEQSYIENILRLNKGKRVDVYTSFPDSLEWKDKIFSGIIEQSGRDHIILSDPTTGAWYLILMIYVDYITFSEQINYNLDF